MSGMSRANARQSSKGDRTGRNSRRKLGLVAKAGKRRPPHIKSERDRNGKRNWVGV